MDRRLILPAAAAFAAACSGTTVPYTFEGEPVCADYAIGAAAPARGGLKQPLHVSFKDGSEIIARVVLSGRRTADSPATPILLPDADAEYEIEWAECSNERAPTPTPIKGSPADMKYECGEAKAYATTKVQTKKGATTRTVPVTLPAPAACWEAPRP